MMKYYILMSNLSLCRYQHQDNMNYFIFVINRFFVLLFGMTLLVYHYFF